MFLIPFCPINSSDDSWELSCPRLEASSLKDLDNITIKLRINCTANCNCECIIIETASNLYCIFHPHFGQRKGVPLQRNSQSNPQPAFSHWPFSTLYVPSVSQHQLPAPLPLFTTEVERMKTNILIPKNTSRSSVSAVICLICFLSINWQSKSTKPGHISGLGASFHVEKKIFKLTIKCLKLVKAYK